MLKCELFAVANLIIYQCQIRNTAAAICDEFVMMVYVRICMWASGWVSVWVQDDKTTKTTDWNDLKLGMVVLDSR